MVILAQVGSERDLVDWSWVAGHADEIWEATQQHLFLTVVPVGVGLVVSFALALVALRWPRLETAVMAASGVLYTIPSLAAFAILVPIFTLFSPLTAIIPLTSYTILILVRNIVTGIRGVPPEVREAATGMGYPAWRRFLSVDLPLATPVILAGLRIATVTVVGLVTVTALLGMGGLGAFILRGFRRSIIFPTQIVVGTVGSVLLATILDLVLLGTGRLLTPWTRRTAS